MFVVRGRPPVRAGGISGSISPHSASVRSDGYRTLGRTHAPRCASVHMSPPYLARADRESQHAATTQYLSRSALRGRVLEETLIVECVRIRDVISKFLFMSINLLLQTINSTILRCINTTIIRSALAATTATTDYKWYITNPTGNTRAITTATATTTSSTSSGAGSRGRRRRRSSGIRRVCGYRRGVRIITVMERSIDRSDRVTNLFSDSYGDSLLFSEATPRAAWSTGPPMRATPSCI